jgi:hypothetical protein
MTTSEQDTVAPLLALTDEQVATLNAARDILDGIPTMTPRTYEGGMLDATARAAEHAVFMLLNYATNYGDLPLSYRQLHNAEPLA